MNTTTTHVLHRTALAVGTVVALAACGGSDGDAEPASPEPTEAPAPDTAPDTAADTAGDAPAIVTTGTTDVGDVLTNSGGRSLYGFTPDVDGTPTCNDGCAEAWPPVSVDSAQLPAGLDPAIFSVVQRDDGSNQLAAGGWPLYLFASDIVAGDINGQEAGGTWFLVAPDGTLIGAPPDATG